MSHGVMAFGITWTLMALLLPLGGCRRAPPAAITADDVSLNNQGVALMGQFDFDAAAAAFDTLRAGASAWPGARLNHAIALVNRQGPEDATAGRSGTAGTRRACPAWTVGRVTSSRCFWRTKVATRRPGRCSNEWPARIRRTALPRTSPASSC